MLKLKVQTVELNRLRALLKKYSQLIVDLQSVDNLGWTLYDFPHKFDKIFYNPTQWWRRFLVSLHSCANMHIAILIKLSVTLAKIRLNMMSTNCAWNSSNLGRLLDAYSRGSNNSLKSICNTCTSVAYKMCLYVHIWQTLTQANSWHTHKHAYSSLEADINKICIMPNSWTIMDAHTNSYTHTWTMQRVKWWALGELQLLVAIIVALARVPIGKHCCWWRLFATFPPWFMCIESSICVCWRAPALL